jgi:hypothetical protein
VPARLFLIVPGMRHQRSGASEQRMTLAFLTVIKVIWRCRLSQLVLAAFRNAGKSPGKQDVSPWSTFGRKNSLEKQVMSPSKKRLTQWCDSHKYFLQSSLRTRRRGIVSKSGGYKVAERLAADLPGILSSI